MSNSNYQGYLQSEAWRSRHNRWLELCDHRDLLFPWKRIGWVGDKYHPYSIHHMNLAAYENKGNEKIFLHIAPLSRSTHEQWLHGCLSGGKRRVREQKDFPNKRQRLVNQICRVNFCLIQILRLFKER